ncbi:helix-turn-helix transcriptional regulator [Hymenobacter koreensis]|uniref:HTH cro/C1-type domain-containing protein n=1 Tax=Hymenobacter koreensis TaxID=1084523 RepID=A0ABP8IXC5_9BACT
MSTTASPLPDISLTTAVRLHLGLSMRQLARYLGVTAGFVNHLETGRRGLPPALAPRLLHLAQLLPPPLGPGPTTPPEPPVYAPLAPLPAPDAQLPPAPPDAAPEPLRRRRRDCQLRLLVQGQRLAQLQARAAVLAHRRWGLALLQITPAPPEPPEAARYARWLGELATDLARDEPDPAAAAATRHLLAARVAGLRAEVAALTGPHP